MKIRLNFVANSSSEAFILNTGKSLETVKRELQELVELYRKQTGRPLRFENVFGEPKLLKEEDKETLRDYDANRLVDNLQNDDPASPIIVYSASDNTVPYGMMDWIEDVYDGTRVHLG